MNPLYTFIGGAIVGYLLALFKYVFDAEKSRFDFKAKILQDLWKEVLLARSIAANIDPEGVPPQDAPPSREKIEHELERFNKQEDKAKDVARGNQPFYPAAIHDLAMKLLLECRLFANFVADPKTHGLNDYWKQNKEMTNTVNELRDQLAEAIRVEINRPSINPFVK